MKKSNKRRSPAMESRRPETVQTTDVDPQPCDIKKKSPENVAAPKENRGETIKKRRQTINGWLLMVSAVVLFVLAPGIYFWHYLQTRKLADFFLLRADELMASDDPHNAAENLQRYLQINPHNAEVRTRLAETYDRSAADLPAKRRAIDLYYQAIGWASPEKVPVLRSRLGELQLETGQYLAAELEARKLIAETSTNESLPLSKKTGDLYAKALRLKALAISEQCKKGAWKGDEEKKSVAEILEEALKTNPGDSKLIRALAEIYRENPKLLSSDSQSLAAEERNRLADAYMDELVEARPEDPEALLARYSYKTAYNLPDAAADLERALRFGENHPQVLLAKANAELAAARTIHRQTGRFEEAQSLYESAKNFFTKSLELAQANIDPEKSATKGNGKPVKTPPRGNRSQENWLEIEISAYTNLGLIEQSRGDEEMSVKIWKNGLEKIPESVTLNLYLADALLGLERTDEVARVDKSRGKDGPLDVLEMLVLRLSSNSGSKSTDNRQQEQSYGLQVNALQQTVRLLRGKWHYLRGEYAEALPILQQVANGAKNRPQQTDEAFQAYLMIGNIQSRQLQIDSAVASYEAAAAIDRRSSEAHLGAAQGWEKLGRIDLAIKHVQEALETQDSVANRIRLAQLVMQNEMLKPASKREWTEYDQIMKSVSEMNPKSDSDRPWMSELLDIRASALRKNGSTESLNATTESIMRLTALEDKYPNDLSLAEQAIGLYESFRSPENADRALERYLKLHPSEPEASIARARLAVGRMQYDLAQEIMEEGIEKAKAGDRISLTIELAGMHIGRNRFDKAGALLRELLKTEAKRPTRTYDAKFVEMLCAMAVQTLVRENPEESIRWERELERVEGSLGTLWRYCRARRLIELAKTADDPQFQDGLRVLGELRSMRPSWAQGFILEAISLEKRGKLDEAADAYRNAIQFGSRRLDNYEKLVGLLNRLGRYADARNCLDEMKDQVAGSTVLTGMEISLATEKGQWQEAIELARKNSEIKDKDPQASISLSQLLEMDNQGEQAKRTLEKAIQKSPGNAALHYQLLCYYVRNRQTVDAEAYLTEIDAKSELSAIDRKRLVAQGYELLGDGAKAKAAWLAAVEASKNTPSAQTALAEQLLGREPEAAEMILRRVLKSDASSLRARRLLAQLLLSRGGEKEWNEALSLLSAKSNDPEEGRMYQELTALIYASRGGKKNLEQARTILEKLVADGRQARAEDFFLLAKIFEAEGNVDQAREQLSRMVRMPHPTPVQLAAYLKFLLESGTLRESETNEQYQAEIERWLNKLRATTDGPQTIAIYVKYLSKFGRQAEIKPYIENWAESINPKLPKNQSAVIGFWESVGELYRSVGMNEDAERWYRRAMETDSARYPNVARELARLGRHEEAIRLCRDAVAQDASAKPYVICASIMADGKPKAKDFDQANEFLANSTERFPDNVDLFNMMAAMRIQESRMDEAIALLREVVDLRPRDVMAINNLATLLAEQPDKLDEGKTLLDRAISLVGPQAGLLDLKGVILIAEGKPRDAIPLFEEACAAPQADARFSFHGAVAYQRAGELKKAEEALKRARQMDLDKLILTPGDKKLLAELDIALMKSSR
jgi:tetratricopeptide (TPR) repeat protein